jgi:hypothetical protein
MPEFWIVSDVRVGSSQLGQLANDEMSGLVSACVEGLLQQRRCEKWRKK